MTRFMPANHASSLIGLLLGGLGWANACLAAGPADEAYVTHMGPVADHYFGLSVATAGDVDGDGVDDYIVGSPSNGLEPGSAFVYSGSDGSVIHMLHGQSQIDFFGHSVACAGDVNNDGYDDLIVGAPFTGVLGGGSGAMASGKVSIFSGQSGNLIRSIVGYTYAELLGYSVSGAGDVNNDGHADVIIGAPNWSNGVGRFIVRSGADGTQLYSYEGNTDVSSAGWCVSGLGDVNGDGYDEVMASMPGEGRVRVFDVHNDAVLRTFINVVSADFGASIASAGDVDNDGVPDVLIGAPKVKVNNVIRGCAYVYSGATGELLHQMVGNPGDRAGFAVAGVGDVDYDGMDEFLISSPGRVEESRRGLVELRSGSTGGVMRQYRGAATSISFGDSCAGLGDLNGDSHPEVMVGAYRQKEDSTNAVVGAAYVYNTEPNDPGFAAPDDYSPYVGRTTALLPAQLNRDGYADLVAVHPTSNRISIRWCDRDGNFAMAGHYLVGKRPTSVAAADFDRDGDQDLVVTLSGESHMMVLRNNGLGFFQRVGKIVVGRKPMSVVATDLNGDGYDDLAVANQDDDNVSVLIHRRYQSPPLNKLHNPARNYAALDGPMQIQAINADGNNRPDLAVLNQAAGKLSILKNFPNGSFLHKKHFPIGALPRPVTMADLNHDGLEDMVWLNQGDTRVAVKYALGNNQYSLAQRFEVGPNATAVTALDYNLDGILDLAVTNHAESSILVLAGLSGGGFMPLESFNTGPAPIGLIRHDFDGDDDDDLATISGETGEFSVLINTWY
jgi:hypothetical protein